MTILSSQQRSEFGNNGFLLIENALTPEQVDKYLAVVDHLDQTWTQGKPLVSGDRRAPGQTLEVRNAIAHAPELLDLLMHETTFPLVAQLMGHNISLTTSHVFLRPPSPAGTRREFKAIGWHHDGPLRDWYHPVNGRLPWLYTKIGYFLSDTRIPDCGALRIVPGSHLSSQPPACKRGEAEPFGGIELKVPAGTAVIFENRLWHAVGPNYAAIARKNIYFGYCWRWMRPIDYVQMPEHVLARATPEQRQLLGEVRTSLGYILPDDSDVPLKAWMQTHNLQPPPPPSTLSFVDGTAQM